MNLYLTYFRQLMFVNPVLLPACIPVVTIPAAFTALNRVCIKLIHGRYTLVWLEFRDEFCRSFGRSFKTGLTLLAVFQYAFVLNAALDLPAWAILKNSRALTFLGLKYTIGILGITCFVDAAMLFGFLFPWCFWCWGFPPWCSSSCAAWEVSPCRSGLWSLIFVSRKKMPECNGFKKASLCWAFPVFGGVSDDKAFAGAPRPEPGQ